MKTMKCGKPPHTHIENQQSMARQLPSVLREKMFCKIMLLSTIVLVLINVVICGHLNNYYDRFNGTLLSEEQLTVYDEANVTRSCAIKVKRCDENEGRRVDGSCNNLQYVTRGASNTPVLRVLPALFHNVTEPRLSERGEPLPECRRLRTDLLLVGHRNSQLFTQLVTYFFIFMTADIASLDDTGGDTLYKTNCCKPEGQTDDECIPIKIPYDDPVHRFSNIRCMNQTKPKSFQAAGCLKKGTSPEIMLKPTPHFDLSPVYGSDATFLEKGRVFEGGLLKNEVDGGKIWPPSLKDPYNKCVSNKKHFETRCHDTPDNIANFHVGLNLLIVWLWRNHNKIANELAQVNTCWNDDEIFENARDINIATVLQIFYYEYLPSLMGRDNLLQDDVISFIRGHRDIYEEKEVPQISIEFTYIMRWMHVMQEGSLKMYDAKGKYFEQIPIADLTLRAGYVANNIDGITKGSYIQPCGRGGRTVHPDMADFAFGPVQKASDVFAYDLCQGRYYGLQTYVQYLKFCTGKEFTSFEDLKNVTDTENIKLLKQSYQSVNDIDLMAGMWLERPIDGGHVPPTFYCLAIDQLKRSIRTDRHWYERSNRPKAFNSRQLQEIRKATFAKLLCDVGDSVAEIQPNAFKLPGFGNRFTSCKDIDGINLRAWNDLHCSDRNS